MVDEPSRRIIVEKDAFMATLAAVFHVLYVLYQVTMRTRISPRMTEERVDMRTEDR